MSSGKTLLVSSPVLLQAQNAAGSRNWLAGSIFEALGEVATVARARILLADDHSDMRSVVVKLLEPEFEMLEPVADGFTLLEKARQLKPDVCLLDISMPILNGIETAAQLGKTDSKAKIVFLTIHTDLDFVQAALKSGASGYVIKSRIASDLNTALREVLAGRIFISPPFTNVKDD